MWILTADLTIGRDPLPGHDFSLPDPLGADSTGKIYVIDPGEREVRRFDATGRFESVFVRSGGGPGEMQLRPLTYGLKDGLLWFTEHPTGRLHFIAVDGSARFTHDTGLTAAPFGVLTIRITPIDNGQTYLIRAEPQETNAFDLRPTSHVQYFRARGQSLDTLIHFRTPSSFLRLDGGRTSVRYPGPNDHTVAFYDEETGQFLRIDRPVVSRARYASILLQWMDGQGTTISQRELLVEPTMLRPGAQDSIAEALHYGASFGGSRTVDPEVRQALARLTAAIPERLPAFDEAALGGGGTIWLRLQPVDSSQQRQDWLVLDRSFNPVALARTPDNVLRMAFRDDRSWWATLGGDLDVQYIARLAIDSSTSR